MPTVDPERWRALSPYLDQAFDIAVEGRAAWLNSIREQNPALADELQTLLGELRDMDSEGFLQTAVSPTGDQPRLEGQTVGAYTVESQIGRGGMGTVWMARRSDGRFQGRAAIKFLNFALVGSAGEDRFKREGNVLARLAHPNIAHLIDAGTTAGGQPYLVLEYVEGQQIDQYCDEQALDVEARIKLFLDVLAAVAHAHANLIVHRDIKPSNVLVTSEGRVKLLDFGIAKLLEGEASPLGEATVLTRQGGRALTLAYAAPEQVTGAGITTATDVYTLGILLYILLCGKHPADSVLQSPSELIKAILETDPPRPSDVKTLPKKRRSALRGDLDNIVAKALKKNPLERYASVTAFADDLRKHLGHQPISARPDTLAYRAMKFVRRYRLPVAAAALVIASLSTGVYVANRQRAVAEMRNDRLRLMQAERMLDTDPTAVLAWLKTYRPNDLSWPRVREIAADALSRGVATHVFRHEGDVSALAVSTDGTKLASSSEDGTVRVWDVATGQQLKKMELERPALSVSFSADGKWLAAGGLDAQVRVWEMNGNEAHRYPGHQGWINEVVFHPQENILATAGSDGTLRLWHLPEGTVDVLMSHSRAVNTLAFSPDGDWLASGSLDGSMHLWKRPFKTGRVFPGARGWVAVVRFSPDSQWIAWAGQSGSINLSHIETRSEASLEGHQGAVAALSFSPDSRSLASSSFDKTIRLWDLSTHSSKILAGHENRVKSVSFSPNGRALVSVSSDRSVRVWDPSESESRVFIGHRGTTNKIVFHPNGTAFCTSSIDGTVRLWTLSPYEVQTQKVPGAELYQLAFSADGTWVGVGGADRALVWNRKTGQTRTLEGRGQFLGFTFSGDQLFIGKVTGGIVAWHVTTGKWREFAAHSGQIRSLKSSSDGTVLVSAGDDGTVRLWNTREGTSEVIQRHRGAAARLAISPEGREIFSGGDDGVIQVFDRTTHSSRTMAQVPGGIHYLAVSARGQVGIASQNWATVLDRQGQPVARNEHTDRVTSIAFSSDGEIFASASLDRTIRVWNSVSGSNSLLRGHQGPVKHISFSKQGHRLASASEDGTARIWDVDLGIDQILRGHLSQVTKVAFAPNDELLATAAVDQTLRLWHLKSALDVPRNPSALSSWLYRLTSMTLPQHEAW